MCWLRSLGKAAYVFHLSGGEDFGNRVCFGSVATRRPTLGPYIDADSLEAVLLPRGQHRRLHISPLGMGAASAVNHFIQRIDVRLCRSDDDIGIGSLAVDNLAIFFDSDGDFTL